MKRRILYTLFTATLLLGSGCKPLFDIRKAMYDQPKYETLEATDFFGDRRSARPLIEGTVAQGQLRLDDHLYQGLEWIDGEQLQARTYPFEITMDDLKRGKERYEIFCSVCHGVSGYGDGIVVQRGFPPAPGYHSDHLRNMPPGYFYSVATNGYGKMKGYASQIPVEDRWRIAAYIQTLQRSQNATLEEYEAALRAQSSNDNHLDSTHDHH
ncbi:MAG: cytochrome c [Kiritimatiellae bacterium]|nr:cytochrome c [Kiritimatiellia bacterium]